MSPRWNWDSPTPLAASECALPPAPKGGGAHSPAVKGVGESQFQRLEKRLALCLLCGQTCPHLPYLPSLKSLFNLWFDPGVWPLGWEGGKERGAKGIPGGGGGWNGRAGWGVGVGAGLEGGAGSGGGGGGEWPRSLSESSPLLYNYELPYLRVLFGTSTSLRVSTSTHHFASTKNRNNQFLITWP